jgi:CelD/BcsL family acetyltransferase involved in cellulose biosynthesis
MVSLEQRALRQADPATARRGPVAEAPLRSQRVREVSDWDAHAGAWDQAALRAQAFYLGHAWLRSWWSAFGSGTLELQLVWQADRVVGLAPWHRRGLVWLGLPVRIVQGLFNAHVGGSDVVAEGDPRRAAELLLEALDAEPWDVLRLRSVPLFSPGVASLREAAAARGLTSHARSPHDEPFVRVTGDWSSFLERRSPRLRKNLRHKRNRLAASGHEARYARLAAADEVDRVLPEVMDTALRSWSGREGSSIASPLERPFYETVLPALARSGALRLWTLRLSGRLAAFEVHVRWGRRVAIPKAAYDAAYESLSPGSLLEAHALEGAFATGECERVDLLGVSEPYKRRWTDDAERRVDVFVFNRGLRARCLEAAEFTLRPPLGAIKRRLAAGR